MKTIASYCYEQKTILKYEQKLEEIQTQQFKKKVISGFVYGLTYFIIFAIYGLIFYLSAIFIR